MEKRQLKLRVRVESIFQVVLYLQSLGTLSNLAIVAGFKECEWVTLYYYLDV